MNTFIMKKIPIVFLLISFCFQAFAQVGGIKSGSDKNSTSPKNTSSESKDGSGCLTDACGAACGSGCFNFIIDYAILGSVKLHKSIMAKRPEIPEVLSIELMPHIGFASPSSSLIIPRIRGNWGLFSTDFRYTNMMDFSHADSIEFYNTLDWQILELNMVVTNPVTFRVGTGIMKEFYSSQIFIEHFLGLDITSADRQYLGNAEFRIAKDYSTGATPRIEGNLRFNYRILKTNNLNGYAMAGAIFQNYYGETNVWTMQTGLYFNFH
jgi:hypothetical protein